MALRALMLRKRINEKQKELESLRAKDDEFARREDELEKAVEEAGTEEEAKAVEEAIDEFEQSKAAHEEAKEGLEKALDDLEGELKEEEAAQEAAPAERKREEEMEVRDAATFDVARKSIRSMGADERRALFARDDVKGWIGEVREHIAHRRELTNVGLTIPEVFLGLLKENVDRYSKLYKHVTVRRLSGTGREIVMGSVPEGVWTECCGALNELSLGFNDVEVNCYKVGGYFKVCNAVLEDSDVNLAAELLDAIGQAIGYALDKAILYGQNTSASNGNMPMGVVTRLVQTSQPSGYPSTARTWVDLHSTNIASISSTGISLFQEMTIDAGAIKGEYARGRKTWIMNETTYTYLKAQAMSINAAGAIVSGMEDTMPVIGGDVEILEFVPDYVVIGGYFELYLLSERAGSKFAQSEHAFFLNDQTAFKGTARYDGVPVIAEAFAAIGVNGVTPTDAMTFASDSANDVDLASLTIGSLTLDPEFDADTTVYTVETSNASNTVTAIASNADASVVVTYNGDQVVNGSSVSWASGDDNVIIVTVENGNSSQSYQATVTYSA